jgi:hypothetical protein
MHHTFDWFEWCCAGDVAAAIAIAAQYKERRE